MVGVSILSTVHSFSLAVDYEANGCRVSRNRYSWLPNVHSGWNGRRTRQSLYLPNFNSDDETIGVDGNFKSIQKSDTAKSTSSHVEYHFGNGHLLTLDTSGMETDSNRSFTGNKTTSSVDSSQLCGSLGDIMDGTSGLVTSSCLTSDPNLFTSLEQQYGITNPLDRMALTANGNLQRLISSYYDAPVEVLVAYCHLRSKNVGGLVTSKTWDRQVHLSVLGHVFCTAQSVITVHDAYCQVLVESNQVGLGQLFRYLDLLPEFTLHNAGLLEKSLVPPSFQGRGGGGGFWRNYSLQCKELTCDIYEEFPTGLWNLKQSGQ